VADTASASEPLVLILPDGGRMEIVGPLTIGRGDDVTIKLTDQTVSRMHARIALGPYGPTIEDAGSSFGVFLQGQQITGSQRLTPGVEIRLGNAVLHVEGPPPVRAAGAAAAPAAPAAEAPNPNATIVVPIGATQLGLAAAQTGPVPKDGALRPRVRSGWALKRLDDDPNDIRYVLKDLRSHSFLRMDVEEAELFEMINGKRTVAELLVEATKRLGPTGAGRLARLLADFGERGMLDGIAAAPKQEEQPSLLRRAFKTREKTFDWVGDYFIRAHDRWGHIYFSEFAATLLLLLSLAGLIVFSYLIGARFGTPFVVAHKLLIGGLVFIGGRFFIVFFHETAHGMALAHFKRRTDRAGLKLVFIFPYAFVDTSESYFATRMQRIWISAAGIFVDFSLGAVFSIACAVSPKGNIRDVFFQLAFAGYIGAFFNANPFLDRDGYQIITEWLREPNLKTKARAALKARLSGKATAEESSVGLLRYSGAGLIWSLLGAAFVGVLSLRYEKILSTLAPHSFVVALFIVFFVVLLLPVPIALGAPLLERARYGEREVNRVVKR
jgi:putative peptide zinc metalloprotease protein